MRRLLSLWVLGTALALVLPADQLAILAVAASVAFLVGHTLRNHPKILFVIIGWLFLSNAIDTSIEGYERPVREPPTAEAIQEARERVLTSFEEAQAEAVTIRSPFYSFEGIGDEFEWRFEGGAPSEFQSLENLIREGKSVLPYMLLGFWLWQLGLLKRSWEHRKLFTYLLVFGGGIGLVVGWCHWDLLDRSVFAVYGLNDRLTPHQTLLMRISGHLSILGLVLAYISLSVLLLSRNGPGRLLKTLAPAGRMAFTLYVLQFMLPPVLFPILFGWWLPSSTLITNIVKVLVVFVLLVLFSTWWFKRFRFGPFEWLWRSLTYWKLQPLRVEASSPTT